MSGHQLIFQSKPLPGDRALPGHELIIKIWTGVRRSERASVTEFPRLAAQ